MPKLTMMSAPSASGKSTLTREMLQEDGNAVRINRDDLRAMSILKWSGRREKWIIAAEMGICTVAAKMGLNIIIDDTNLMPSDEDRWKNVAKQLGYDFNKVKLDVDIEVCVERDKQRRGIARLGRPTIERQFLRGGLWKVPAGKKTVIFDIDGTIADLTHRVPWIRIGAICPMCEGDCVFKDGVQDVDYTQNPPKICYRYKTCPGCEGEGKILKKNHDQFYARVLEDKPIEVVLRWLRACKEDYYVLIVSGRSPEKCGEETCQWLEENNAPYDHIIMRRSNMHGPDDEEKQLILNDILKMIPKEDIAFVVDDRPSVVAMWRRNGLKVYPVRGRDDDKFYEIMDEMEKSHPQEEGMEPCSGADCICQAVPVLSNLYAWKPKEPYFNLGAGRALAGKPKPKYKRPLKSYFTQAIVKLERWWAR